MTPEVRDIITTFAAEGRTPQETAQALSLYREDVYESIKEEAGPNVRDAWAATEGLNADIQEGLDTLRDSSIRSFVDEKIPDPTVQNEFWTQIKNEQPIDGRFGVTEQDLIGITNEPTFRVQADSSAPINVDAGQRRLFSYQIRPRQNETFEALVLSPEQGDMLLSFTDPKPKQIDEMAAKLEETRKQNARDVLSVDIQTGEDYGDLSDEEVEVFALDVGPSNLSAEDTAARRDAQQKLRLTMAKLAALRGPQGKDFARNELLVERMKQDDMIDFVGGRGVGDYAQDLAVGLSMFGLGTAQTAAMATGNQEEAEGLAKLNQDIQETTGSFGVEFSGGTLQRSVRGAGISVGMMAPALAIGPAGRAAGMAAGTAETVAIGSLAPATYSLAYNESMQEAKALEQQGRVEEAQKIRNRTGIRAVADTVFELGVERINPFFSQVGAAGWARRLPKQVFQEAIVEEPLTMLLQQEVSNRLVDRPSSYEQLPEVVLSAAIATTGTQAITGAVSSMLPKTPEPMPSEVNPADVARNVAAAAAGQPVQVNPQAIRPQDTPAVAVASQTNPETLAAVVAMTTNTTPVAAPQSTPVAPQTPTPSPVAPPTPAPAVTPPVTPPEIVAGVEELSDAEALAIDAELGIEPISPLGAGAATTPQGAIESPTAPITGGQTQTQQPGELDTLIEEYGEKERTISERIKSLRAKEVEFGQRGETGAANETKVERLRLEQESLQVGTIRMRLYALRVGPALQARQQAGEELNRNEKADLELYESLISQQSPVTPTAQTTTQTQQQPNENDQAIQQGQGQVVQEADAEANAQTQEGVLTPAPSPAVPTQAAASLEQQVATAEDQGVLMDVFADERARAIERQDIADARQRQQSFRQLTPPQTNVQNQVQEASRPTPVESVPSVIQPEGQAQAGTPQREGQGQEVADLMAVRDNTATPEQVQRLQGQGLVEQLAGQAVITQAGIQAMPEAERPRLTEQERRAEIQQQTQQPAGETQQPVVDPIGYGNALIALFPSLQKAGVQAITIEEAMERLEVEWQKKQASGKATRLDQLVYMANKKNTQSALDGANIGGIWTRTDKTVAVSSKATPSAMAHEIGHAIMELEYANAPEATKKAIEAEYSKWFAAKYGKDGVPSVADQRRIWEWMTDADWMNPDAPFPQEQRVAKWEAYRSKFSEWFADEVAKWAATRDAPKSLVDKFFSELAQKLKKLWDSVRGSFSPNETLASWLDSISVASPAKTQQPAGEMGDAGVTIPGAASTITPERAALNAVIPEESRAEWTPEEFAAAETFLQTQDPSAIAGLSPFKRLRVLDALDQYNPEALTELEREAIIRSPQYTQEWLQDETAKAQEEGIQDGDTVITRDESGETIVGTVAATTGENTTISTTSGDVTVPTAGLVRQSPQSLSRKPGLAQALMESDGAALQLGISARDVEKGVAATKRQIPGASNIWSGTRQDFLDTFGNDPSVQDIVAQLEEGVMTEGFYVPSLQRGFILTDGVVVYQGDADRAAINGTTPAVEAVKRLIRHEVGGHGGWLNLTERQTQDFLNIARDVIPVSEMNQMIEDGYPFQDWQTNDETFRQAAEEWFSQRLGRMDKLPETGPLARFVEWLKGVWRWLTGRKTDPDLQAIKNLWRQIRMNEAAIAMGRAWYSLPREGARGQAVTAQDAEYLASASKGDSGSDNLIQLLRDAPESERKAVVDAWVQRNPKAAAEMQRMVDETAKVAGGRKVDYETSINPEKIIPRNEPDRKFGKQQIAAVAERMRKAGKWIGRPILVVKYGDAYQGVTGSHRTYAAQGAEVEVEAIVVPDEFLVWMDDRDLNDSNLIGSDGWINAREEDQYDALRKAKASGVEGLDSAIDLLFIENESNWIDRGTREFLSNNPVIVGNNVKSADPVTYDSSGNPIPLSQRFQSTSNDIRYSRVRSNTEIASAIRQQATLPNDPQTASEGKVIREDVAAQFEPNDRRSIQQSPDHQFLGKDIGVERGAAILDTLMQPERDPAKIAESTPQEIEQQGGDVELNLIAHEEAVRRALVLGEAVSTAALTRYGISLPPDYRKFGELSAPVSPALIRATEFLTNQSLTEQAGIGMSTTLYPYIAYRLMGDLATAQTNARSNVERVALSQAMTRIYQATSGTNSASGQRLGATGIAQRYFGVTAGGVMALVENVNREVQGRIDASIPVDDLVAELNRNQTQMETEAVNDAAAEIEAETEIDLAEADMLKQEGIAEGIIEEIANRLGDAPVVNDVERKEREATIRDLHLRNVRQGMTEQDFIAEAATFEVYEGLASRLWNAGNLEREARATIKAAIDGVRRQEIAESRASRLIYSTEERLRQGSKDLDSNASGDSINKAFRDQIKAPVSLADFKERLSKLSVGGGVAERLFRTAEREKADLAEMDLIISKRREERQKAAQVEIAESRASQLIYSVEERLRQGSKDLDQGTGKDTINKAFRDQVKSPVSQEDFNTRLAALNVSGNVAERLFKTAERERTDLAKAKEFTDRRRAETEEARQNERAEARASQLIYSTEEKLRQGSKDLDESESRDSINKAFRDQIKSPVSLAEFKARLAKLRVGDVVADRLFKTASRERDDMAESERFLAQRRLERKDQRKIEIAQERASQLIYGVEERLRQGQKDMTENAAKDTINKAFRDQVAKPVSFENFQARLRNLRVNDRNIERMFNTAERERIDLGKQALMQTRENLLEKDSPHLAAVIRRIKDRIAPGISWRDLMVVDAQDGKQRARAIYQRVRQHEALRGLSPAEAAQLTRALNRHFIKAKEKVLKKELERVGAMGTQTDPRVADLYEKIRRRELTAAEVEAEIQAIATPSRWKALRRELPTFLQDLAYGRVSIEQFKEKIGRGRKATDRAIQSVIDSTPKLIQAMNLGAFNAQAFRDAVSEKFGLRVITSEQARQIQQMVVDAQALQPGLPRDKAVAKIIDQIADYTQMSSAEIFNSFWVSSVLSGGRTQFDTWMNQLNAMRRVLQLAAWTSAKRINAGGLNIGWNAITRYFEVLPGMFQNALWYLWSGDSTLLLSEARETDRFLNDGQFSQSMDTKKAEKLLSGALTALKGGDLKQGVLAFPAFFIVGVRRLMQAADYFSAAATLEASIPLAIALNPELAGKTRIPSRQDYQNFRLRAREILTGGREPSGMREKVEERVMAQQLLMQSIDSLAIRDEIMELGIEASYQNDPTGIGGIFYNSVLAVHQKIVASAEALRERGQSMQESDSPEILKKADAAARNLMYALAVGARALTGLQFARFAGNKTNELLGMTPLLGLARLAEKDKTRSQKAMIIMDNLVGTAIAVGGIIYAMGLLDDDDDDERRGWRIEGGWDGLTADEKRQLRAAGKQPYSIGYLDRQDGTWKNYSYLQWATSGAFATIGNLRDRKRYRPELWNEDSYVGATLAAAAGNGQALLNMSMLQNLNDIFGGNSAFAARDPVSGMAGWLNRFSSNYAGGFIPRAFKDADYMMDPRHTKANAGIELWLQHVPFYRRGVGEPYLDSLGYQVELRREPWSRAFVETQGTAAHNALASLVGNGMFISSLNMDNRVVRNGEDVRPMTDAEQKRMMDVYFPLLRRYLVREGARIERMPMEDAKEKLSNDIQRLKSEAQDRAVR